MTAALLLAALLAADATRADAVDREALKKLAGKWVLTRREHGGEDADAKAIKSIRVEIDGAKMTIRDGDDVKEKTTVTLLDAKAKPASVDLEVTEGTGKGDVVKGIYKLEGGKLTICVAEPGKERPAKFEGAKGTGHTLMVLQKK